MKLNRKEAVIFDLDGTLVDSMWMWRVIDIEYLARSGLTYPDDLQRGIEGMSFSEAAVYFKGRFQLKETLDEIKNAWIQTFIERYRKEVLLRPGAGAFPEFISGKELVAGIATSNGRAVVDAALDSLDVCRYFKVVVMACEVATGKPAPDIYLNVAERLQAAPKDYVVFEDVPAGIQVGKNAGITVFAMEDAFSLEIKEGREKLVDYYIRDCHELLNGAAGRRTITYL